MSTNIQQQQQPTNKQHKHHHRKSKSIVITSPTTTTQQVIQHITEEVVTTSKRSRRSHSAGGLPYINHALSPTADEIRIDVHRWFDNAYYTAPLMAVFDRVAFLTNHFGINEGKLAERARINSGVFSRLKKKDYDHSTKVYYEAFLRNETAIWELKLIKEISDKAKETGWTRYEMLGKLQAVASKPNAPPINIGYKEFDQWFNMTLPLPQRKRIDLILMGLFSIDDPELKSTRKITTARHKPNKTSRKSSVPVIKQEEQHDVAPPVTSRAQRIHSHDDSDVSSVQSSEHALLVQHHQSIPLEDYEYQLPCPAIPRSGPPTTDEINAAINMANNYYPSY